LQSRIERRAAITRPSTTITEPSGEVDGSEPLDRAMRIASRIQRSSSSVIAVQRKACPKVPRRWPGIVIAPH
jgi:hypothetical protein